MEKIKNKGIIGLIIALLFGGGYVVSDNLGAGARGDNNPSCTLTSPVAVEVGDQNSLEIMSTTSRRAFVRIQQPVNATNTVSFGFNDEAAVINSGLTFEVDETGSTTPSFFDFGLNTEFSYTGAVSAITETGSTTLIVTECNYTK